MTYFQTLPARSVLMLVFASSLTLSACATKPDRRGPPPDRQGGGPVKTSGTFMQPIAAVFIGMDTNQDKVVSTQEYKTGVRTEWATFGRNPSAIRFSQWSIANLGSTDALPTFMSFDRDFNGSVSEAEFTGQLDSEFQRLDKNQDGQLERAEMLIAFAAPRGEVSRKSGGKGKGEKGSRGGGRPPR